MTETEHQILVMVWAKKMALLGHSELDLLFHIPNGGSRSKREGAQFKAMGVKAGVPDLCLPVKRGEFGALWIEMKADNGKVSPEQQEWHQSLLNHGGNVCVAWSWKNAIEALCAYLGVKDVVSMEEQLNRLCGGA